MSDTTHKPLSKEGLLHTAEILHLRGEPVPTDILARLLEVGVDISKYSKQGKTTWLKINTKRWCHLLV